MKKTTLYPTHTIFLAVRFIGFFLHVSDAGAPRAGGGDPTQEAAPGLPGLVLTSRDNPRHLPQ